MTFKLLNATLLSAACAALFARSARAQAGCELFLNREFTGTTATLALPSVTATFASGAPLESAWANSSRRSIASELGALNNAVSAARILALDSDVALYLFDGGDLNGKGNVLFCKRGFVCTLELGSDMNDRTSSAICQREYFRKAMLQDPNSDLLRAYFATLQNPIFDLSLISRAVDLFAQSAFAEREDIDAYRAQSSEDGFALWSRTTWITGHDYCKRFNLVCQRDPSVKYDDLFRISKRFEIDVNGFWADFTPFLDDDYVIEADWYVRPVISDSDGNPATQSELGFWWARTVVWVEAGKLRDAIAGQAAPVIFNVDIQKQLRDLFVFAAGYAGCAPCIDGKNRLQFSIHNAPDPRASVWLESFEMDDTAPKLVLNDSRDAIYED